VTFAGSPRRFEARLVPEAGYELDTFEVSGLPRRPGLALARALVTDAAAPAACLRILRRRRPQVVLGGGGYVAGPMVLAAALLRIPSALTEADAHLGLANRLAAPFARRVFLSFPIAGLEEPKYRVTGRPLPRGLEGVGREEARALFDLPPDGPGLLVFGGSQGSTTLNNFVLERFRETGPRVLHLCGERDFAALEATPRRADYRLLPFASIFGAALAASDLVLARAGGSIWEVAAAGKPAILVPYPHATADHQTKNARFFERAGGAVVVPEHELARAGRLVEELLGDPARLDRMARAMGAVARPGAADEIADELVALAAA